MAKTKIKTETDQSKMIVVLGTEIPVLENILLADIIPNPLNPRKEIDQEEIIGLSESILKVGVIQPIVVRPAKSTGKYELVCGERRFLASKLVNTTDQKRNTIPASIRNLTDAEAMELMITENLQRKDVQEESAFMNWRELTSALFLSLAPTIVFYLWLLVYFKPLQALMIVGWLIGLAATLFLVAIIWRCWRSGEKEGDS